MAASTSNISSGKRITSACNPSFTVAGTSTTDCNSLVEVTCNPNITADEQLIIESHTLPVHGPVVPSTYLTIHGPNIPGVHSLPSKTLHYPLNSLPSRSSLSAFNSVPRGNSMPSSSSFRRGTSFRPGTSLEEGGLSRSLEKSFQEETFLSTNNILKGGLSRENLMTAGNNLSRGTSATARTTLPRITKCPSGML